MRDYKLQVMLSKEELAVLDDLAAENGETRSGYMRRLLADKIRREARKRRYSQMAGGHAGGGGTTTPPPWRSIINNHDHAKNDGLRWHGEPPKDQPTKGV